MILPFNLFPNMKNLEKIKGNTNRYVLPTPNHLREPLSELNFHQLYSYPVAPELPKSDDKFIFLDSGAFGLDQFKCEISLDYMKGLSAHYELYKRDNVFCVAPDSFLNPNRTIQNIKRWVDNGLYADINVVFQFPIKYRFDVESIEYLLDEYAKIPHSKDVAFIANPRLDGAAAEANYDNINRVCELIRENGYQWIHMLGAGWDVNCITKWAKHFIGSVIDSMDSVAYYKPKTHWNYNRLSCHENAKINNAFVAQKIINDYAVFQNTI